MGDLRVQRGLRLAVVVIALVHLFVLGLPALLIGVSGYRSVGVEVAAFVLVTVVLVGIGQAAWRGRRPRFGLLFGTLAVAEVMALAAVPPAYLVEPQEWSFGVVSWAGMLLLLDHGLPAVVVFLAGHLSARLVLLAVTADVDRAAVAGALFFTAGFLAYQIAIAFAATLLRRMVETVAAAAREEERVRTAEAVAERLHRDRRERYAGLDAVPLLTGLAAGVLDPADERVRTRCAVAAGRMRRLFAERDEVPDPLMHELQACADTAERRGVTVYLGACGFRPDPPLPVRRALTEPVLAVLATARAHARVTVLGSPTAVTVSVVADGVPPELDPPGAGVAVTRLVAHDREWVEVTWRI